MATDPLNKTTPDDVADERPNSSDTAQAASTHLVQFDKVVKRYGDHVVLDHLDFTVQHGQHVTLIGPSDGVIWVNGEPLSHMRTADGSLKKANEKHQRQIRKKIGMVFQQFNLFPNMNVLQNITDAPINVLGIERAQAEERARELLELVGLQEKVKAHPTQLSGGQQQRVAIARALAMQPEILLLDEVTSALDPELVAGVLDVLRDVAHSTDITLICVTHEMNFARDISDQVLMFDSGRIIESGPADKMFGSPDHERTREFLSAVL